MASTHPSFPSLNLSASFPICVSSSSMIPPFQKACQLTKPKRHHVFKVACNGNNSNNNPTNRRDVLIGLGGLYGATTLSSNNHSAFAAPVTTPEPTSCVPPIIPDPSYNCCPPTPTSPVIDFKFPTNNTLLRVRQPAHLVSDEYLAKYKEAVRLMKALPADDPRNFTQQANVHCAYCDGGYRQIGYPDRELQVHSSWLFFPFHRLYLYFYERILGSLIGDPTFALPFWNWDHSDGMKIPSFYTDKDSPLYNPLRDARHQPPVIVDLNYDPDHDHSGEDPQKQIETNLSVMYRQVVSRGKRPSLFLGKAYRAGCPPNPGAGSLELIPHNTVHTWTGDSTQPNDEDMGALYSAARDSIFFAHHANVDRMWNIWKTLPGGKRRDFTDDDWLESSFLFYDENKNLVRVKVEDSLDTRKLGYDYQHVDLQWLTSKPKPKYLPALRTAARKAVGTLRFPLTLISIARTTVKMPKVQSRISEEEKEDVLVIDLDYDLTKGTKFDVFINDQGDDQIGPGDSEFAGSFVHLPHSHLHVDKKRSSTSFTLGITDLLKECEAKADESITVTLVPKYGEKPVIIKGIKIKVVGQEDDHA
ncbi:hypothetical protein CR513_48071, partial [Mucuna pruriens]